MWRMIASLLILVVVMGQSVLAADKKPRIADPFFEKVIRLHIKKPTGELTKADLEKVTRLSLTRTKITDAGLKEVAKLQQLTYLNLWSSPLGLLDTKITKAGVAELQRALPKCRISHDSK